MCAACEEATGELLCVLPVKRQQESCCCKANARALRVKQTAGVCMFRG